MDWASHPLSAKLQPMKAARLLLLVALAAAIVWVAWLCTTAWRRASSLPADAQLVGYLLPEPAELEPFIRRLAARVESREVYLNCGDALRVVPLRGLGFALDVDTTLERAARAPRANTAVQRLLRVLVGPPERLRAVEPACAFDQAVARETLERLAPLVKREAVSAALDFAHHRRIDDAPGRELDIDASLDAIEQTALIDDDLVPLQFRSIPSQVTSRELPAVDVTRVLSTFETSFAHRAGARAVNIRRGVELLDGFILAPHTVFSFNHVVGPREESRGFIDAPVIVNDELDKGVGGGICQVASTLHAAAVYAGLPVLERRSHSRPSGYAPLGLDATVIDGKVDLRLSNPYDEPLLIHAFLPTRTSVKVEILGRESQSKIEHNAQVIKRHPFLRRVVEKPEIPAGEIKRSQKGTYGYEIVSFVRSTDAAGAVTTRQYKSNYYPVPEVFWVSPGTPLASLPPLPEGAEGLEDPD